MASIPMEECTERIGVPVCIAGPVLDACVDGVEVKGEDVLARREAQWLQERRRGWSLPFELVATENTVSGQVKHENRERKKCWYARSSSQHHVLHSLKESV